MDTWSRLEGRQNRINIATNGRQHREAVSRQRLINCLVAVVADRASPLVARTMRMPDAAKRAANNQQAGKSQRHYDMPKLPLFGHHIHSRFKSGAPKTFSVHKMAEPAKRCVASSTLL